MRVSEIFYSLQGETSRIGLPTVFIRLTGCPLRCGYCDTAYAFTGGENMSITAILQQAAGYRTRYVTVTGGE
ncbi:MAG TPA: 7-carboxy-7-deazaguanine synthase QueE, partial [Nitrosomonas sp.]|nr:7-carboxy-7-deazaguanine synthase QueE [Nitrosomonas sp.]